MKTIKGKGYIDCVIDGETVRLKTVMGHQCDTVLRYDKNNELFEDKMESIWASLEFIIIHNYVILLTKNDLNSKYNPIYIFNRRLQTISDIYKKLSSELYTEIKNFIKYEVV
jgi:hypothetical protein